MKTDQTIETTRNHNSVGRDQNSALLNSSYIIRPGQSRENQMSFGEAQQIELE